MKKNLPYFFKYLIGASLALIAVSNCFNVLSNSALFVASPSSEIARAEADKPQVKSLNSPTVGKPDGGASNFSSSLNSSNGRTTNLLAGVRPGRLPRIGAR